MVEFQSYVRGYHAYMQRWSPVVGQALSIKREPANVHDVHAVAVYYETKLSGMYIPYNPVAPTLSAFLVRDVNKGFAEVTGEKVNRGALEIPCTYRLYGPKHYVDRLKAIVENWRSCWICILININIVSCMDRKRRGKQEVWSCGCDKLSAFGGKFV